jgi:hypothetical protein
MLVALQPPSQGMFVDQAAIDSSGALPPTADANKLQSSSHPLPSSGHSYSGVSTYDRVLPV